MGKVILVTGASSGIGWAVSKYLSLKGHIVYGASRSATPSEDFKVVKLDVTDDVAVKDLVKHIVDKENRIDAVINCAGVGSLGAVECQPVENLSRCMDINVSGVARVSQAALPYMRQQGDGYIVNVSSVGSVMGLPFRAYYCASKAALDTYTETMRLEVARFGIKVCLVHPGDVNTEIVNNRLIVDPDEDKIYGDILKSMTVKLDADCKNGLAPEVFGPRIEKILHSRRVKRNYYVGTTTQLFSVKLKKILPYYLWEKLIMSYYKTS